MFLFPLLLAVIVALWALYETPYDGPWTGTTSRSHPMSLTASGSATWSNFKYKTDVYCEHYGVTGTIELTTAGPGAITDGQFSFSGGTYAFIGAFDTPTTASGTYTLTNYPWTFSVPPPIYVHTHYVNQSSTWTASFSGTLPVITVTSPNGGESWAAGSTGEVTWTQTGLTSSVTIDLYKGGVYNKTLGTASAIGGTFSWVIGATETAGTDYRILVWQGAISDESDANFAIVRVKRADFNKDGQEDILWRYNGSGEIQGWNVVWLMHQSGALSPVKLGITGTSAGGMNLQTGSTPIKSYLTPMDVGNSGDKVPAMFLGTPLGVGNPLALKPKKIMMDAVGYSRNLSHGNNVRARQKEFKGITAQKDKTTISAGSSGTMEVDALGSSPVSSGKMKIASLDSSGLAFLTSVLDTAWEIVGTGDFNGDGNTDILWRYYGGDYIQGWNVIWYMDGTTITSYGFLPTIRDTNWKIAGTGDFDGDGKLEVLWRYYGSGEIQGWNVIWHLDGETIASYGYAPVVLDTNWRVDGIGDFNGDGKSDMLWRYYGSDYYQGLNVIWYMDGQTLTSYGYPTAITNLNWKVDGIGDYDGDGKGDILWRYYGSGYHQGLNVVWYMDGATIKSQENLTVVWDTNWRIVNR
jgi:hypothetical protein